MSSRGLAPVKGTIVTFITAAKAVEMIYAGREKTAPRMLLPRKPGEGASKEAIAAYEDICAGIDAQKKAELDAIKAELVKDEGHPELPPDHIVRDRTEGRCRLVGCDHGLRKARIPSQGLKQRRRVRVFCGDHSHLRREIPRKDGFFDLRTDPSKGLSVAV